MSQFIIRKRPCRFMNQVTEGMPVIGSFNQQNLLPHAREVCLHCLYLETCCHASANLNALPDGSFQALRGELVSANIFTLPFKPVHIAFIRNQTVLLCFDESLDAVVTVGGSKDLNAKITCRLEKGSPQLSLHFPVQAVLELVDEQD